jgi:hypothetical protein
MKKYLSLMISTLLAVLFLSRMVLSVSAAPTLLLQQGMRRMGMGVTNGKVDSPQPVDETETNQQNTQTFQGVSGSNNRAQFIGRNQANSGNPGENRGFNQDDSNNAGNMVSGQKKSIDVQENNQTFQGDGSGVGNSTTLVGSNQGNSGNEGVNFGNNQDNANNSGNQVNNQANIIGTQINNQGSVVNNQGNIIGRQINYLSLLPGLHLSLSLHPLQVSLSTAAQNTLPQTVQQHPNVTAAGSKARR